MTSIFLSYARNDDEAFVRRLYADLTKAGFDVWFDRVSMPSRQLTFHQEIRDAIAARDRLVLVVGPGVLTSDYVRQEWRFAYFEAGKCVNPIVRLNGRSPDGETHASQSIDGYELIPEDLKLLHAEDFRDDAHYDAHLVNLVRQLSEAIPPVGKLVAVPELPACFLAQPDRIKALRDLLLVDLQKPVVVSGAAARVGLQGMGGIGKSVLASALAHRPEMRRAFPDGIFWITLGQKPQLAEQQRWLARELGDEALFPDERSGKECLRNLLAGRKALLVLDDVWQREDAEAFNVIGAMGRILLTTRDAGLVTALASKETHYRVELPTEAEAEGIFAGAAGLDLRVLPTAAREIVAQCGRLPLALALCGGMVQGGVSLADVLEALREHDLEFLSDPHSAEEQHQNAWKAMDVSLRVLSPEQRDRFAELAVFALDRGAPEEAVVTLWEHTGGLAPRHSRKLLTDFAARSLVQLTPAAEGDGQTGARMSLHDLLHNFATGMAEKHFGSLAALHQTLLDAYTKKCPSGWPSGPDDGYYFQNLCEHLLAAGKLDEAVELLTDLPWIEAKCKVKLVFSLQNDYRNTIAVMPEAQEGLRQERERQARLARWTREITEYSRQWSERRDRMARGEVVSEPEPTLPEPPAACRMWTVEEIEVDCTRIIENPTRLDRIRAFAGFVERESFPLMEFGARAEFVVQHAFNHAPIGSLHARATESLQTVLPLLLVRRWFSEKNHNPNNALLRTLECPKLSRASVAPDGRRAVSASWDGTLRVWDLETGMCLRVLQGHTDKVWSVSMTPDGQHAISASDDKTLRVWDLETGSCQKIIGADTPRILSVSITADARRAVSGGYEEGLRVWDLETGECQYGLKGHTDYVGSVCVTPDGKQAVSGSWDRTVRVWDIETGECLRELAGHTDTVYSVSTTPDGRRAVSASLDNSLRVWNLETGTCLRVLEGKRSGSICPDGNRAISAGSNMLRVWDLHTGACKRVLNSGGDMDVSITLDGRRAVSTHGKALRLWNLESGASLGLQGRGECLFDGLTVSPDGMRVISRGVDNALRLWGLEAGDCLLVLKGHFGRINEVKFTRDGRNAVSASDDKTLRVWNLDTGACLRVLEEHSKQIWSVSLSPDELRAVSAGYEESLRVWDLKSGACLHVLEGHIDYVKSVCVMPDGLSAVSASIDSTLRVWDLETGACRRVLEGHKKDVNLVHVTRDGQRAVSASDDTTLRVWNLENGTCLRTLEGHTGSVWDLCVTPDERRAVSVGSNDRTLRVWDLETGSSIQTLEGHTDCVTRVSLTSNGQNAVSVGEDNTVRVWDLETGRCLAVAPLAGLIPYIAPCQGPGRVIAGTNTGEIVNFDLRGLALSSTRTVS